MADKDNSENPEVKKDEEIEKKDENEESIKTTPAPVPYDVFKAKNDEAKTQSNLIKDLQDKLAAIEKDSEKAKQKELEDKQEWEQLANQHKSKLDEITPELESLKSTSTKQLEILTKLAESQLELVPELYKPIIQKMPILEQIEWLAENSSSLETKKHSGIPKTPAGSGAHGVTDEDRRRKSVRTF